MALIANSAFGAPSTTNATDNEDTSSATIGDYSLSVSATESIDLDLSVSDNDTMTVSQGYVSVTTTSPGYKLFMSMLNDNTSLRSDNVSGVIAATSGTFSTPSALTRGTWGYAIPSGTSHIASNGFNATYTEMSSASATDTPIFATPPVASSTPQLIASSNSSTTGDTFPIYYAIRANSTTNPGAYSNNIAFTAVADAGTTESMTLTPSTIDPDTATTIEVATTMYSTATNLDATITLGDTALTCTKSSPVPLTYSCDVPATAAGNYTVTLSSPRYGKTYSGSLEVVQPGPSNFFELTTMQEMTPQICATATTPSALATYDDTTGAYAGNTDYVPTKTVVDDRTDGTANTKYSYTIKKLADGRCWMTQNLRLTNATLTADDSNLTTISSFTLPASTTTSGASGWCGNDTEDCHNRANVLDTNNTSYGTYYSWAAAIASTTAYSISSGEAPNSICPKGWHLPKGKTTGDFQYLSSTAGYSTSYLLRKSAGGPAFVLSGYRLGGSTEDRGSNGRYWSSTSSSASYTYNLSLGSSSMNPANTYYKFYGYSVRCVAEGLTLDDISTMQEMTPGIAAETAIGASKTLTDTRDGNTYTVRKLADGKIWMTQNLRLGKQNETITLTSSDSNVTSDYTLPKFTSGSDFGGQYVYVDDTWGGYYSFAAATAGTNPSSGDASSSICPKGWKLPSGSGSSSDFQRLYNNYNSASKMQATDGPAFVLSGNRIGKSNYNQGSTGYYWSSAAGTSYYGYNLNLDSSSVTPSTNNYKHYGFSVRCVAKY